MHLKTKKMAIKSARSSEQQRLGRITHSFPVKSLVAGLSESELDHGALGDGESNCSSDRNAPAMRTISLEELQRKAGAWRR